MRVVLEVIVLCASALHLAESGTVDEFPDHVKFAPMNLIGVIGVGFCVALVSPNEIRHMHFPDFPQFSIEARPVTNRYAQSGYASTLGTFQSHSVCTMRSDSLEKNIPGLKCFEHIRGPCSEELHGNVRWKRGIVDTGNECPQCGVVIKPTKPLRDVYKFFNLPGTMFGSVMAKDK